MNSLDMCRGNITVDDDWNITVSGMCGGPSGTLVKYEAAAPADLHLGYSGTGLPFPNEQVAYERSPNIGTVLVKNGTFRFRVLRPNSYYVDSGRTLVKSHVRFTVGDKHYDVLLPSSQLFKNRSLTSLPDRPRRVTGR